MSVEQFCLSEQSLGELLDSTVAKFAEGEAVVYVDQNLRQSWKDFALDVDELARGLMALGVQKGEKVAIWAPNVPYWVSIMFATAKIGAILLTINTSYRANELKYILQQSDAENLVLINEHRGLTFLNTLLEVLPEINQQQKSALSFKSLPKLKRLICLEEDTHPAMYTLHELRELGKNISAADYSWRKKSVKSADLVNMQYTSGTTGFPKGVMLSHSNIVNNGYWVGKRQKLSAQDRLCLPVPLFHCFGCVLGVMAAINHGTTMVFLENFAPSLVLRALEKEKCTGLYGVPTMFIAILEHKLAESIDFSSLRTGIMAGSLCPAPLMEKVIQKLHMPEITITYGLTESSPAMTMSFATDDFEHKTTTAGKALPGVELCILDLHTSKSLPAGKIGEICCRGYNVMQGYYNMPKENAEAIDAQGFLHSGDLGKVTEDGYLVITGRIKDMIIRGGENIYPREIEEFIAKIEGVSDVQVVSIPSHKYGEELAAFIILKSGASLSVQDIRKYAKGKIAWHKVPRYVHFLEDYPKTASGKVQKFKLRALASEVFYKVE